MVIGWPPMKHQLKKRPAHRAPQKIVKLVQEPGMLYRVRDKDWEKLWGEGLSWDDAHRLKEAVSGRRLSKTVRVEPMSAPAPQSPPPIENIGRVALANAVRPEGTVGDDELEELEGNDDAGKVDRMLNGVIRGTNRRRGAEAVDKLIDGDDAGELDRQIDRAIAEAEEDA